MGGHAIVPMWEVRGRGERDGPRVLGLKEVPWACPGLATHDLMRGNLLSRIFSSSSLVHLTTARVEVEEIELVGLMRARELAAGREGGVRGDATRGLEKKLSVPSYIRFGRVRKGLQLTHSLSYSCFCMSLFKTGSEGAVNRHWRESTKIRTAKRDKGKEKEKEKVLEK